MNTAQVIPFPGPQSVQGTPPPHDLDAEAAVLSACMINPEAWPRIRDFLRPEHMFSERHAWILRGVSAVSGEGKTPDSVTVASWLRDRGRLGQVEHGYVVEVLDAAPAVAPTRLLAYAEQVHKLWRVRKAIALCQRFAAEGYHDVGEAQAWLERCGEALTAVARCKPREDIESNADALRRILRERLTPVAEGKRRHGLPTGLKSLDELIAGLRPGKKTTVAALTGRGKTAFGLQAGILAAMNGVRALVVSVEVSRDDLLQRALSAIAGIDHDRLRKGQLHQDEWTRLMPAMQRLGDLPLDIVDAHDLHVGRLAGLVRQLVDAHHGGAAPLGLVVVDYVQRLSPAPEVMTAKKHEQVAHATKALKLLAQDHGIAVLELAQAKASETGRTSTPDSSCIADSGAVAKESDAVVFLHRPNEQDRARILAVVAKQRDGEEGECELVFEGHFQRFRDPAERP